jgi:hypothetical protein
MLLDHLIAEMQAQGTVTVEWAPFATLHFPGRNGMAQAREWAAKRGYLLIFIQPGERDTSGQPIKATFYRAMQKHSSDPR